MAEKYFRMADAVFKMAEKHLKMVDCYFKMAESTVMVKRTTELPYIVVILLLFGKKLPTAGLPAKMRLFVVKWALSSGTIGWYDGKTNGCEFGYASFSLANWDCSTVILCKANFIP